MTLDEITQTAINPALDWLPGKMDSTEARLMMLTIGLQESQFIYRRQMGNGPARSFWQMERGGAVTGVLTHGATKSLALSACSMCGVAPTPQSVWEAIEFDDVLAAIFTRLNLWWAPGALPTIDDAAGAWAYYMNTWRPGKPHRHTWDGYYAQSRACLGV